MRKDTVNRLIKLGERQTDTLRFIAPILHDYGISGDHIVSEEFVGAYLGDKDNPQLDENVLLLRYKPSKDEYFAQLDNDINELSIFLGDYDKGEDLVYILRIDDKYAEVLNRFKNGKFTEFDDDYKKQVLRFWRLEDPNENHIYDILHNTKNGQIFYDKFLTEDEKNNTAKDELWPIPNMDIEIM